MLALLLTMAGFALVESLNVLNLAVTSAIVYDSRLQRRSPLPGGLSFLGGLFSATAAVGITVVVGLAIFTEPTTIRLTPWMRYTGELTLGMLLIFVACYPSRVRSAAPRWTFPVMRRNPLLLAVFGVVLGFGQSATDVMYLGALAMLSTYRLPISVWPVVVIAYCAIELWPSLLVLFLGSRRTARARRIQRRILRTVTRFGPLVIRALCLSAGCVLVAHSLLHCAGMR